MDEGGCSCPVETKPEEDEEEKGATLHNTHTHANKVRVCAVQTIDLKGIESEMCLAQSVLRATFSDVHPGSRASAWLGKYEEMKMLWSRYHQNTGPRTPQSDKTVYTKA